MATEARYAVELTPLPQADGGGWLAVVPELPGCMADGDTPEQALQEVRDAIASYLATAREHGDPIAAPSRPRASGRLLVRMPRSLHARLSARARQEGVSINTLVVTALAETVHA